MVDMRKKYSSQEKAKIALEALKEVQTMNELTSKYGVHATQINQWKRQLKDGVVDIFTRKKKRETDEQSETC